MTSTIEGARVFIEQSTRRRQLRVGAAFVALMQIGVFAVLSPADVIADAARFGLPAHVESPENRACAAHHGHFFCQVARSLPFGIPTGRIAAANLPAPSVFTIHRPGGHVPARSATFLIGAIVPRGPPLG